jgi:hypothetical protein
VKHFLAIVLALSPLALAAKEAERDPLPIVPCESFGPIRANTSFAELIRLFGRENVQDTEIEGAEGETYPGAIVFPADPVKKLKVIWKEAVKKSPAEVSAEGTKSVWKTPQGVTLGMRLKDLEKINGRAVTISGLGWDDGGRVLSWNRGTLASAFPQSFSLQLDPDAVNPRVIEMSCQFP